LLFTSPDFLDLSRSLNWRTEALHDFLAFLDASPLPDRLLELGSGTGFFTRLLRDRYPGGTVVGVDLNRQSLRRGAGAYGRPGEGGAQPLAADAARLPFATDAWAAVVTHFFFVDCIGPERALREAIRVTRTGGMVACLEPIYQTDFLNSYSPVLQPADREVLTSAFRKVLIEAPLRAGIERGIAPRLPALFRASGLVDLRIKVTGGFSFSAALDPTSLDALRQVARAALRAKADPRAATRGNPLLEALSEREIEALVAMQQRLTEVIAEDPEGYREAGYFTAMTLLFLSGRKP
jgi:ubiquinone/menaquinone biosynthesis C-methylase UbiE